MTHIEIHGDPRKIVARRELAGGMAKFAAATATIATCVLSIMLVFGNVDAFSDARDQAASTPTRAGAADAPYFPAQYQLNAPDEVPKQIDTF